MVAMGSWLDGQPSWIGRMQVLGLGTADGTTGDGQGDGEQNQLMRIYLREEPEVVAGKEDEYAAAVERLIYPILEESDVLTMRPVGAFRVDTTYGSWPNFMFLWSYEDGWDSYAQGRAAREQGVEETGQLSYDSRMIEYVSMAGKWRQRSMERVLVPVRFSPTPPPRPAITSAGRVFVEDQFIVLPGHARTFLEVINSRVVAEASDSSLQLELFARAAGRPYEFYALWSLPSWNHLAAFQQARDADGDNFLPGVESVWPHLEDLRERTLMPMPYSPLGGVPGT